jgi:hypothetical protein
VGKVIYMSDYKKTKEVDEDDTMYCIDCEHFEELNSFESHICGLCENKSNFVPFDWSKYDI